MNLKEYFSDPDGDTLAFTADSYSGPRFLAATVTEDTLLTVTATFPGTGSSFIIVTAVDPGMLTATQRFTVKIADYRVAGPPEPLRIDYVYVDTVSVEHKARFRDAADYFEAVLAGTEVAPLELNVGGGCRPFKGTVRGLTIWVTVSDGAGLANGGPCRRRPDDGGVLPLLGRLNFDPAAMDRPADADFERLVRHEVLHVLGIGTGPGWLSVLDTTTTPPHFPGSAAVAAFRAAGGDEYGAPVVPVLDDRFHWRVDVMGCEVMSSGCRSRFARTGEVSPTSAITLGALADVGWTVDMSLADPYTLSDN